MQYKLKKIIIFFCLTSFVNSESIKIDRVILACDKNSDFLEFWPVAAKAWKDLIGAKPTLALIADKSVKVDETCGDVIRFQPITRIPTSFYAQTIRLLLPSYFENEVCLISDVNAIPLSKKFFSDNLKIIPDDFFVLCTPNKSYVDKLDICYPIAKGKLFKEIFFVRNTNEIPDIIKFWYRKGTAQNTTEFLLYKYLTHWKNSKFKTKNVNYKSDQRIDREKWNFFNLTARLIKETKKDLFIDIQCPMPYGKHKKEIDSLMDLFK